MKAAGVIVGFATLVVALGVVAYIQARPDIEVEKQRQEIIDSLPKPAESGPHPKIVVADPGATFEFGEMILGDSMDHKFLIRNEGEAPLELKKVFTTCKCTLGEIGEDIITPGEETEVTLTWTPKAEAEEFAQTAVIKTNDPELEELELVIKGQVLNYIRTLPADVWSFGTISEDESQPTSATGVILCDADESFEVLDATCEADAVDVSIKKLESPEELEQAGARAGAEVTIAVRPGIPVGRFTYPVKFKTNSERVSEVTINIGGNRSGPFTILGQGWIGANSQLNLKKFSAAEGISRKLLMMVDKAEEPLELEVETMSPPELIFEYERDESYSNPKLEKYMLNVGVKPGIKSGAYDAPEDRGVIKLKANHPRFSELTIEVRFSAE